jgi:dihydroneopterin aldolase
MDKIFIEGLALDGVIGVYDFEKTAPQPLVFDYELGIDLALAAQSDDLKDTVDYAKVAEMTASHLQQTQYELLEPLAENLCQLLFKTFPALETVQIKISKPQAVANAQAVGIKILRLRTSYQF